MVCQININGRRTCLDPCQILSCPEKEHCVLSPRGRPVCECKPGHSRNRLTGQCNWVDRQCGGDSDCAAGERCVEGVHHVGVRTCEDACTGVSCGAGAECLVTRAHFGACRCADGFSGKPGERAGCAPVDRDECQDDGQCDESQVSEIHICAIGSPNTDCTSNYLSVIFKMQEKTTFWCLT